MYIYFEYYILCFMFFYWNWGNHISFCESRYLFSCSIFDIYSNFDRTFYFMIDVLFVFIWCLWNKAINRFIYNVFILYFVWNSSGYNFLIIQLTMFMINSIHDTRKINVKSIWKIVYKSIILKHSSILCKSDNILHNHKVQCFMLLIRDGSF